MDHALAPCARAERSRASSRARVRSRSSSRAWSARARASGALIAGSVLMPVGFLLGGLHHYEGDPGFGIFLAPLGALALLYPAAVQMRGAWRRRE